MSSRLRVALLIATVAALAEILLVVLFTLRMGPDGASLPAGGLWALIKVTPLLILLPALLRGSSKGTTWLCFLLCGYFVGAVLTASDPPPARWFGVLEIAITTAGFIAGLLATRWSRQPRATAE